MNVTQIVTRHRAVVYETPALLKASAYLFLVDSKLSILKALDTLPICRVDLDSSA